MAPFGGPFLCLRIPVVRFEEVKPLPSKVFFRDGLKGFQPLRDVTKMLGQSLEAACTASVKDAKHPLAWACFPGLAAFVNKFGAGKPDLNGGFVAGDLFV